MPTPAMSPSTTRPSHPRAAEPDRVEHGDRGVGDRSGEEARRAPPAAARRRWWSPGRAATSRRGTAAGRARARWSTRSSRSDHETRTSLRVVAASTAPARPRRSGPRRRRARRPTAGCRLGRRCGRAASATASVSASWPCPRRGSTADDRAAGRRGESASRSTCEPATVGDVEHRDRDDACAAPSSRTCRSR